MSTKMKKMICLCSLVVLSCLFQASISKAQDPVSWWKFDDGSGTTAIDSSGHGNNGTIQGDVKWTEGKIGSAIQFNGTNTSISAPHIPLDNHSFTITMWINPTVLTVNHTIFSQGTATNNSLLHIRLGGPKPQYGTPVYGLRFAFYYNDSDTPANIIQVNTWYHLACVYDSESKVRRIYIDGVQMAQDTGVLPYISKTGNTFMGSENGNANRYNGILDDVRVYDRVLTKDEVRDIASLGSDVQFQGMYNTLKEAGKLIKGQKPKQAIPLLEKEIAKYDQLKQKSPGYDMLACELHYMHGTACEAVGEKKNTIGEDYKKSLFVETVSDENIQGTALLWLFQNMNADYNNEVNSFLTKNKGYYLKAVIAKSETLISKNEAQTAINFLEGNIASYTQWQKEHPFDKVVVEDMLPNAYYQIAKAKEATKAPAKDIAEAYSSTFKKSSLDYIPQRTAALIWLVENNRTEELTKVIKSFTQEEKISQSFKDIVSGLCKQLESEKDVKGFQLLLDTLFKTSKYPAAWATVVEASITDKTNRWSQVYYSSLQDKPRLQFAVDCNTAEQYVAKEKYKEAADLYKNLLTRCEPNDNKGELEFRLLKCLFDGGSYSDAVARIDSFTSGSYKGTHRNRIKEALLMKGRALIQLGDINKAITAFSSIMIEYPETKDIPETTFYIGYCYMLQNKFKEATETFEIVSKSYPDSTYANQAKLLLTRIKDMTK